MNLNTWLRQPSTITGLAFAGAAVAGALSQLATGNPTIDGVAATIVLVLTHLGIDDHSAAAQAAGRVEVDIAGAIASRNPLGALPATLEDVAALARALQPLAAAANPPPAPVPAPAAAPVAA